jgi:tetratricopeptide (TPR) repeat protein
VGAAVTMISHDKGTSRPAAFTAAGRNTLSTSAANLDDVIRATRMRVAADPADGEAAVLLADALMRAARVYSDASLPLEAERALRATLRHQPDDYAASRMLAVVLLSQHRFADAFELAQSLSARHPRDAWNHAVAGDALLEVGRYDEAFEAFDSMMKLRPDAAAYARVAYARELRGDLEGAAMLMKMSADSTGVNDPEGQAWALAQLANLYIQQGRLDDATRELNRAEFTFPSHPYVCTGRVRVLIARRNYTEALALVERAAPTPETLAVKGDLLRQLGRSAAAEAAYEESERLERDGWQKEQPQPGALARFLAQRGRKVTEAVTLAESAAKGRHDINTADALAWSYFQAGRISDASRAIARATRTGTADRLIRCHEKAIAAATAAGLTNAGSCSPLSVAAQVAHQ